MSSINLADLFTQYQREDAVFVADPGDYELEVIRASVRNDNAVMPVFKITGGPHAGKTVMAGQMTLTEKSRSIFFRQMNGFGLGADFFQTGPSMQQVADALVGRVVKVRLTQDEWPKGSGEYRNKLPISGIQLVRAGSGVATPAAPPAPPAAAPPTAPAAPPAQPPQPPAAPPAAPAPQEQAPAAPAAPAPAAPPAPPVPEAQPVAAPAAAPPQAAPPVPGPPPVPGAPPVPAGGQPF